MNNNYLGHDAETPPEDSGNVARPSGSSSGSSGSVSSSSSSGGSSSSSSGDVEDAGSDATVDATELADSGPDAVAVADSGPDAEPFDAGPPECTEAAERCSSYAEQSCVDGRWTARVGEACCFTEGRYLDANGGWWTDSVGNLQAFEQVETAVDQNRAWNICANIRFARLPTKTQVLSQILPSGGACSPGLDEHVFTENGGDVTSTIFYVRSAPDQPNAPERCIDVTTGENVSCDSVAKPAFFCMRGA